MCNCVYWGCYEEGILFGGFEVIWWVFVFFQKLVFFCEYSNVDEWLKCLIQCDFKFFKILKWIGCFVMVVNEENVSFSCIVIVFINGVVGVILVVFMYYVCFFEKENVIDEDIVCFLFVVGEIGSLFKKGVIIFVVMGGCQVEIGVFFVMAVVVLIEGFGGIVVQVLMAVEIVMEYYFGFICDFIGGFV